MRAGECARMRLSRPPCSRSPSRSPKGASSRRRCRCWPRPASLRPTIPEASRKLILASNRADLRFVIVRASDVPTYVQYGAADLGVAGKDVLLEHGGEGLYQPLDLAIARCRMVVAARRDFDYASAVQRGARLASRPSTSAPRASISRAKGMHVDLIKLYGSMELAPLVGLADAIVDLVSTGKTLQANDLVVGRGDPADQRAADRQSRPRSSSSATPSSRSSTPSPRRYRAMPEIRRLDPSDPGFASALATLTALDTAGRRCDRRLGRRHPRRRARPRRRRGARIHARVRPGQGDVASPRWNCRAAELKAALDTLPADQTRGARAGRRAHPHLSRAPAAPNPGRSPRPTARASASRSRRSTASASTFPAARPRIRRRC